MRECTCCGSSKPLAEFYVRRGKASTQCKFCEVAKTKARYATRPEYRAKAIERALADHYAIRAAAIRIYGGRCVTCGATEGLEFDHVNGGGENHRKTEGHRQFLRRIVVTGQRATDHEVQLLCKPCHTAKSDTENHQRDASGRYI